ncbi:hypothetical protein [Xenorhabdus sp. KJ12.1]|uniref:hypothetical protein n=1 Tax=Xenorhabdus sp. KJ12.1 TaxID=1851571 RepID=UPI000C046FA8|nr:hypothetical protein [Xenorhabdus sp. KJ12.1]PHM72315.1 hypothetical protein Xekj_00593 [Xenorhabdus sp. KJ12.1]
MNKLKYLRSGIVLGGVIAMFVSSGTMASMFNTQAKTDNYSKVQPTRIAGETPETLRAYKESCPECVLVAKDIANMRQQFCDDRNANIDTAIAGDPVYAYLNGVRMVLSSRGGYYSSMYTSARQIVEANVDCNNAQDWIDRSQHVLSQTFNNGQPLN